DFYSDDEMIITISHLGYIKRTPLTEFRTQNRGGVGARGSQTRDEDFVEYIYPATNHNYMLFFTQKGKCYWLRVFEIPEGTKISRGRAIQNLLNIDADDSITAFIRVNTLSDQEYINSNYLVFATEQGVIKKTLLEAYSRPRQNGVIAISLRDDDKVIAVRMTNGKKDIIMANRNGRAIRFNEEDVRPMGRTASGVRGMRIDEDGEDYVIGMISMDSDSNNTILVVSEQGYGKRTLLNDEDGEPVYRITRRGGKGVKTLNVTDKTGKLVSIKSVTENNDLMIINKSGITIRLGISDLRTSGRATQGVRLINLDKRNDEIASVCKVSSLDEEDEDKNPLLSENGENINNEE
ncbi:MAG: DNA gyrase subunit A, partial [Proteiniphilum sp.]|nr:DNA gyrase subunit A [Proteiniphilum sp.]